MAFRKNRRMGTDPGAVVRDTIARGKEKIPDGFAIDAYGPHVCPRTGEDLNAGLAESIKFHNAMLDGGLTAVALLAKANPVAAGVVAVARIVGPSIIEAIDKILHGKKKAA